MAKKLRPETIRYRLRKDLEQRLENAGIEIDELYASKLDEYMEMYDHRRALQEASESPDILKDKPRLYMDITKEMRQLDKSMRDMLDWMGIGKKSKAVKDEREEDYEL